MSESTNHTGGHGRGQRAPLTLEEKLASINRALPFSDEAERGVLCCLLQDPNRYLSQVAMQLPPEAFYHVANRMIYERILHMDKAQVPIDIVTLCQSLSDSGHLDKVGGQGAVNELFTLVLGTGHFSHYKKMVWDKYLLRGLIDVCADATNDAYTYRSGEENADQDVVPLIADASERMDKLLHTAHGFGSSRSDPRPFADGIDEAMRQLEVGIKAIADGREIDGVKLGIPPLDREFHGIKDGTRVVVGAHSSTGKTSILMQMARYIAGEQRIPMLIFSLDGLIVTLARRALASLSDVPITDIHSCQGFFHDEGRRKMERVSRAASIAQNYPIAVVDDPALTFSQQLAIARRLVKQLGVKVVAWDYFQNLSMGASAFKNNRTGELDAISKMWKGFCMEHKVTGIMLAQLNWEKVGKGGGKLTQENIKDCKALFDDAENVILLQREERTLDELLDQEVPRGNIGEKDAQTIRQPACALRLGEAVVRADIAKNKDGRAGVPVFLRHYGPYMTWHTMTLAAHARSSSYNAKNREIAHQQRAGDGH